jgi:maleylacetate reductase
VAFGVDAVHALPELLAGRRRPMVACSWRRRRSPEFAHLAGALGLTPATFERAEEHTPRSVVDAAVAAAETAGADAVVSFGGGSAVDLGKAVAAATGAFHAAVPTTYSGAAATPWFHVSERDRKVTVAGSDARPDAVVLDPGLSASLPPKPTAGTGFAALGNAWDACAARPDPAVGAAGAVLAALPVLAQRPWDPEARSSLLGASHAVGVALARSGPGAHDALCSALAGAAGVPHGVASALVLPHLLRVVGAPPEWATALGFEAAEEAAGSLERLRARLRLPARLREVGVFAGDLEPAAERAGDAAAGVAMEVLSAAW